MRESPDVSRQMAFGSDGLEAVEEEVETTWADWGVETDMSEQEPSIWVEQASEFGVDDRGLDRDRSSEQSQLVSDVEDDQVTLEMEIASGRALWGSSD